jgi:hypothetical protein
LGKLIVLGGGLLVAAGSAASDARAQYAAEPYYPAQYAAPYLAQAPQRPPSWSYNPYTSGMTSCPQRRAGDLETCQQQMPPTYGQPSYWPR